MFNRKRGLARALRPSLRQTTATFAVAAVLLASAMADAPRHAAWAAAGFDEQHVVLGRHEAAGVGSTDAISSTSYMPAVMRANATPTPPPLAGDEWSQHAHNAQRTSYTEQAVETPWRWRWAWNGPNSSGAISAGKTGLPRNVQPVTGGGRVYVAAGSRGVYALNEANGAELWNARPGGNINSTAAYDKGTQSVFVVSSNGTLYKLNAANGGVAGQFSAGATSDLPLPPAIAGDRVFFSMGNRVFAVNSADMRQVWAYDAGSPVHTPPAYSPSRNRVYVGSADLNVHAIDNASGARGWRVRPVDPSLGTTVSPAGNYAEYSYGWPVVAEAAGYVLVKARLDWQTMFAWDPWPTTNAQMRSNLTARPNQQALFVMDLDDGARPFIANIGHGGFGDGGYMPMGPQPVVKRLASGRDAVYTIIRGHASNDGRWDSAFGEMMLDDDTVSGYRAGEVRFIQYDNPPGSQAPYLLTDEQPNVSMAGDFLFGGHWMAGHALRIQDRSPALGSYSQRIRAVNAPSIVNAQASGSGCAFSASHYCANGLLQDGDPRTFTPGFYIYYAQGKVYDRYWNGYATWVISNGNIYFHSTDGAIVALAAGNPQAAAEASSQIAQATLAVESASGGTGAAARALDESVTVSRAILSHDQVREHAAGAVSVEGDIRYIFNNGKQVLYGFEMPHQGAFKILITKAYWPAFGPAPETYLQVGQRVRVTGEVSWYQGDPVIYVESPAQIDTAPALQGHRGK